MNDETDKMQLLLSAAKKWAEWNDAPSHPIEVQLIAAIDAALWPPPVIEAIDVRDHPHPTGSDYLGRSRAGVWGHYRSGETNPYITHWLPMPTIAKRPEPTPPSPWRSVDDPPAKRDTLAWLVGGSRAPCATFFASRNTDRTHWAPYIGEPMPDWPWPGGEA